MGRKLKEMDDLLSIMRIDQKAVEEKCGKIYSAIESTWGALKYIDTQLTTVAKGIVASDKDDIEGLTDHCWDKYVDAEGFVSEMDAIQKNPSFVTRMTRYCKLIGNLNLCKDSFKSKHDKLSKRINYLNKSGQYGSDYALSIDLRTKVNASISVIDKRIGMVTERFFSCRLKLLQFIMESTSGIVKSVDDRETIRKAYLKNDDDGTISAMNGIMNKMRKEN